MAKSFSVAILVVIVALVGLAPPAVSQTENDASPGDIGIDEQLGGYIPLNLGFLDSDGDSVYLREVVTRPTILTLVYYHCPTICRPLLSNVADVVRKTELQPGADYNLLTISFDEFDTPGTAANMKKNVTKALETRLSDDSWRYLVGDSVTIEALTSAVGFKARRAGKDFAHGAALIVLSPDGKIVRYLYGLEFMPFDVKMAVAEATEGKVVPSIARVLQYCFSYDPEGRRYVVNVTRIAGAGILFVAIGYVFFITAVTRKRKMREKA